MTRRTKLDVPAGAASANPAAAPGRASAETALAAKAAPKAKAAPRAKTRATAKTPPTATALSRAKTRPTAARLPVAAVAHRPTAIDAAKRDGDTERRILDAAHAVFIRRGSSGARMQEIAQEAGVNQALLHYYFRHKERLSEAVFRRAAGALMPEVMTILASDLPLEDKVARIVHIEVAHFTRHPYLPGYVISELTHHPERVQQLLTMMTSNAPDDLRPRALAAVRRQILDAQRAGTLSPIPPDQFIVNLVSLCIFPFAARPMIQALLGLDQAQFAAFIDERADILVAFFLRAIRP